MRIKWTEGIFCSNFYWTLGNFPPCCQEWCSATFFMMDPRRRKRKGRKGEKGQVTTSSKWKEKDQNPNDFHEARNGDHAITPFECDTCIFRKLRKKSPNKKREQDKILLMMIRRANLDAFWLRARAIVYQNTQKIKHAIKISDMLGLDGVYKHVGTYHSLTIVDMKWQQPHCCVQEGQEGTTTLTHNKTR